MKKHLGLLVLLILALLVAFFLGAGESLVFASPWVSPIYHPGDPDYNTCIDRCMDKPGGATVGECINLCDADTTLIWYEDYATGDVWSWDGSQWYLSGHYYDIYMSITHRFCVPELGPCPAP